MAKVSLWSKVKMVIEAIEYIYETEYNKQTCCYPLLTNLAEHPCAAAEEYETIVDAAQTLKPANKYLATVYLVYALVPMQSTKLTNKGNPLEITRDHKKRQEIENIIKKFSNGILKKENLKLLQSNIQNSIVVVSKSLAVCYPKKFAMFDSRVCKAIKDAIKEKNNLNRFGFSINNVESFILYTLAIRKVAKKLKKSLREIEVALYLAGK